MKKYPVMDDLIEACNRTLGYSPSPETIQKDIANMKLPFPDGFDAPIKFNRTKWGYEYTDPAFSLLGVPLRQDELDAIEEAVDIIRTIGGTRVGDKFNHAVEKVLSSTLERKTEDEENLPVLQTMVSPPSRGFEHFDLLYKACKERIPVSFIHFSYKKRVFNHIILHPFLIKEFDNRWYVIGYSELHKETRTFGLDRVSEPILLKKKYISSDTKELSTYLKDIYGVYPIPDSKKVKIKIKVSRLGTHYFKAYPLHESQKITKESNGTSFITFELIPSVELARYFLSQGRHVTIIEPAWFQDFIKNLVV
jgi:predicted DNA-binding transcriptional regulator YafY